MCASSIVDLDLQLGLTTAFGLKVPVVSSGWIMPSVSEISSSCLGSVDSLRWRSLAKISRGVGPSCLSSHAPGHSGRDSGGSIGLEVSIMADGSFWREDKQEDVAWHIRSFLRCYWNHWEFHIHTGRNLSLKLLGPCGFLLFFSGIMGYVKMALLANFLVFLVFGAFFFLYITSFTFLTTVNGHVQVYTIFDHV